MTDTCSEEGLQTLYSLLDDLNLKPADILRELRREGSKVSDLSSLPSWHCLKLIQDCLKALAK